MQYENNLSKCFFLSKTQDLVFKKPFSKRYFWKKKGSSNIQKTHYGYEILGGYAYVIIN